MKSGWKLLAILHLSCLCGLSMAQTSAAFQQARSEFRQAHENSQIEASAATLKQLLQQEPGNPLVMAYSGAATSKLAITTLLPWKKMSYAEEGLATLDKALQLLSKEKNPAAVEIEVKFVAAVTFLAVPDFMNRSSKGQQLLQEAAEHSQINQAELNLRAAIWLRAAQLAIAQKQTQQARKYLEQITPLPTPQAQQAQTLLKGLAS